MAAPLTHLVLADKLWKERFSHLDRTSFLLGTSFPDIRYLGVIDRSTTHRNVRTLADVPGNDPFAAGMAVHALIDVLRQAYMNEHGISATWQDLPLRESAMKLFEDAVLQASVQPADAFAGIWEHVLPEELAFGIAEKDIQRWHGLLADYLTLPLTTASREKFLDGIRIDPNSVLLELKELADHLTDEKSTERIRDMERDLIQKILK